MFSPTAKLLLPTRMNGTTAMHEHQDASYQSGDCGKNLNKLIRKFNFKHASIGEKRKGERRVSTEQIVSTSYYNAV